MEKPRTPPIQCNIDPCPATARWMGGYWGQCSVTCGEGVEEFIHECRQDVGNGRSVLVNEAACPKRPNAETRACNRAPCENINDNELPKTEGDPTFRSGRREWTVGIWSAVSQRQHNFVYVYNLFLLPVFGYLRHWPQGTTRDLSQWSVSPRRSAFARRVLRYG